jgi:hypothetical protein
MASRLSESIGDQNPNLVIPYVKVARGDSCHRFVMQRMIALRQNVALVMTQ